METTPFGFDINRPGADVPNPGPKDRERLFELWHQLGSQGRKVVYVTAFALAAKQGVIGPDESILPTGD
ncbi:hypothetical protein EOD42_08840 [Rhodovarius crocodyli]|uniref:Uncharacterized protein n=1 Tax=Rhodovarius crocodyli TaxID=1979269 RepID=A0A437MJV5_9PROT|nr:hypothetical protein [Rhodovarius crocodyli]RVT97886.1 hypothetical protein EOD42_08840 [Rhodovarius crocodyli]